MKKAREYVQTVSFTALQDDLKKLKKIQKGFKNRSELIRHLIRENFRSRYENS